MNIQQLQYIAAVDEHRHFQRAADACFVTPATLSMMIKKLEQELNLTIFDRSRQPIVPTPIGITIIEKAKAVLYHVKDLENTAKQHAIEISGEIRIAIIPTLGPYLSHLFLPAMMKKYPQLKIKFYEWNTNDIIEALNHDRLDIGIAATPLHQEQLIETPLFQERLLAYTAEKNSKKSKQFIAPEEINIERLWLLEEDHCLRSQVANLCSLKKKNIHNEQLDFEAGSLETLLNIVQINEGITILPELAIRDLSEIRKEGIRQFVSPVPVRQISLLTYKHFFKDKLLQALSEEIKIAVQPHLLKNGGDHMIIDI